MEIYGRLKIISKAESKFYKTKQGYIKERKRVNVKCSCGNEKQVDINALKSGATKSCGCLKKEKLPEWRRKGHKTLSINNAALKKAFRNYKYTASNKNILFELSFEDFIKIVNKNCEYCGQIPSRLIYNETKSKQTVISGIDRIDSNKGYSLDNVKTCCTKCNYAKRLQTEKEFLDWVNKIYKFNN